MQSSPAALDETERSEEQELPPVWTVWTATSYAVVMLLVGLPLWWKTTAVQRVPLPYSDMSSLHDLLESSFLIKIPINLVGFTKPLPNDDTRFHNLDSHTFSLSYNQASPLELDAVYKSGDIYAVDKELCKFSTKSKTDVHSINIYYVGRADLLKEYGEKVLLGNCRNFYYISNSSKVKFEPIWNVIRKITGVSTNQQGLVDPNKPDPLTKNEELQLPLSAGYNILLSLLVPEPEILDSKWEIESAVNKYINPMLQKMKSFAEFSVRSQVLYYTKLNVYPHWNPEKNHHEIPYEQLSLVINPVESKLTSFVSQNPVLNFLTYTSPCSKSPLQILDDDGFPLDSNAFLVPQWGGIFIYNPPCNPENNSSEPILNRTHAVSTDQVMSVIISQFRSLIGLPEQRAQDILDFRGSALRDWEVDMIVRKRLKKLILTAANTLHSLGQLLDEITNIVVTEEVGDQVERSVAAIKAAIVEASEGKLDFAQSHAIEAFKSSEIAFHHPKNLKQLYFPDDQKYAIYIPLFLPVGIPVILSLKGIFRRIFANWKAKQDKKKSKSD